MLVMWLPSVILENLLERIGTHLHLHSYHRISVKIPVLACLTARRCPLSILSSDLRATFYWHQLYGRFDSLKKQN